MKQQISEKIDLAVGAIRKSNQIIAFTGSGISEESGIPTFRDPGGLWDKLDPWEVGTVEGLLQALETKSAQLKPIFFDILDSFEHSEPNAAHQSLSELERLGKLKSVITQNIDNLHQEAGNTVVVEMHGNLYRMKCLSCGAFRKVERKAFITKTRKLLEKMPALDLNNLLKIAEECHICGGLMRPNVVMFGEAVQNMQESFLSAQSADLMLILGTSGVVYPAADLPHQAKSRGAKIIEINPVENAFAHITDIYIPLKAGEGLSQIVNRYKERPV